MKLVKILRRREKPVLVTPVAEPELTVEQVEQKLAYELAEQSQRMLLAAVELAYEQGLWSEKQSTPFARSESHPSDLYLYSTTTRSATVGDLKMIIEVRHSRVDRDHPDWERRGNSAHRDSDTAWLLVDALGVQQRVGLHSRRRDREPNYPEVHYTYTQLGRALAACTEAQQLIREHQEAKRLAAEEKKRLAAEQAERKQLLERAESTAVVEANAEALAALRGL